RASEQRIELEALRRHAESLIVVLAQLSERSRLRVLDADRESQLKLPPADPHQVNEVLRALAARTTLALRQLPADPRGPQRDTALLNLLFGISVAWYRHAGSARGIVKNGGDEYTGPLLTL